MFKVDKYNSVHYRRLDELNRVVLPVVFRAVLNLKENNFYTLELSTDEKTLALRKDTETPKGNEDFKISGAGQVRIPMALTQAMGISAKEYFRLEIVQDGKTGCKHPPKIIMTKKEPGCVCCGRVDVPCLPSYWGE